MRAGCWEALRKSLVRQCTNLDAVLKFKKLKRNPVLARFVEPVALLDLITARNGDAAENDPIYAVLVQAAQARGDTAELAVSLLWLGQWVGLDAIYRRRLKHFPENPEELVSEISRHFLEAVERADLSRIQRISATLVLNTDRLVVAQLRRGWVHDNKINETRREVAAARRRREELHLGVTEDLALTQPTAEAREPSAFGISTNATPGRLRSDRHGCLRAQLPGTALRTAENSRDAVWRTVTLYWWRKRLTEWGAAARESGQRLVAVVTREVSSASTSAASAVQVRLRYGEIEIEVAGTTALPPSWLAELVRELRAAR